MRETWVELEGFPGYSVSNLGSVLNDHTGRRVPLRQNRQGFVMVNLWLDEDRVQLTRALSLLVARAFVHNQIPRFFNSVIHLNSDRTDCRALNLMWRSRSFALRYHDMFNDQPLRVAVYIPRTGERFGSLREACTTYGLVEKMTYVNMNNGEPCFPYPWIIERFEK